MNKKTNLTFSLNIFYDLFETIFEFDSFKKTDSNLI